MLKGKFQERTVELIWAQEPSITLQFWFRSEMAQTSEHCFKAVQRRLERGFVINLINQFTRRGAP